MTADIIVESISFEILWKLGNAKFAKRYLWMMQVKPGACDTCSRLEAPRQRVKDKQSQTCK